MSVIDRNFMLGFVVGAATGAIVAVLTAPQPGGYTRERLKQSGIEISQRAAETAEQARRRAEEMQRKAAETVGQSTQRIASVATDVAKKLPIVGGEDSESSGAAGSAGSDAS